MTGVDPGFVLIMQTTKSHFLLVKCKAGQKIFKRSFFTIKQLTHVNFLKTTKELIFLRGLSCAVLRDFLRETVILRNAIWGWLPKFLNFPSWIPYFEASNLRTYAEAFLEKVSLPKSLIIIQYVCLTLVLLNIITAIKSTAAYFTAWYAF